MTIGRGSDEQSGPFAFFGSTTGPLKRSKEGIGKRLGCFFVDWTRRKTKNIACSENGELMTFSIFRSAAEKYGA